jgi:DNA invertase Pin-like site-specific DNA recombinase
VEGNSNEIGGARALSIVPTPVLVGGYIRVSSRSQDYAYQQHAIASAARARGELVHHWYGDVATGSKMERPQLIKLRDAIRAGKLQRLWVWRLDRLTRSGIVDTISCISEIQRCGCSVSSVADGFPLDGPTGELFMAMIAWAAQHEREKIRENQAAARQRMEAAGRHWGHPPVLQETKRRIGELAEQGLSVREISRHVSVGKTTVWKIVRARAQEKVAV